MVSTDTVIGVVGAVVLAGAMVAVFYYESNNPTLDNASAVGEGSETFAVAWNETTMSGDIGGTTQPITEGASGEHELELPAYTSNVTITVTWTDNDARPAPATSGADTFRVVVTNETGAELCNEAGNSGTITCSIALSSVDQPTEPDRVRGNDTADAGRQLEEAIAEDGGATSWTITVTLEDTADTTPSQLPGQVRDTTNGYSLEWAFTHWMPRLTPE